MFSFCRKLFVCERFLVAIENKRQTNEGSVHQLTPVSSAIHFFMGIVVLVRKKVLSGIVGKMSAKKKVALRVIEVHLLFMKRNSSRVLNECDFLPQKLCRVTCYRNLSLFQEVAHFSCLQMRLIFCLKGIPSLHVL